MLAVTAQEKKDQRIAMAVSVAVHVLLLLFLFYMLAWKANDPPVLPEGGIEISYGTTDAGSGDVNSKATPNDSPNPEDSKPAAEAPETVPTPVAEAKPQPTIAAEPAKVVTSPVESPVSVKEVEKPTPEPPKEEVKKVDSRALFPGKSKAGAGNGTAGTSNKPTGNNNGDEGVVGDKGKPEGLYPGKKTGNGGSGGGSLNMPGWRYDITPKTDPYENESGRVVFSIKINAEGELVNIDVVESNVSPQVVNWYKGQIQKTTFSRIKGDNPSSGATGTITFIIRSN
ncbi:hypothetical protein [Rufibacter ruber]|uniref:hypothetical protein n=1 Tax=Rufibacter ruber TaxID=1783499 RepID=UPI000A8259E9|nr:hypothetical protein [Rufibacter ruber]